MKKTFLIVAIALVSTFVQAQVSNGLVAKYSFNNGNANDEVGTNNGIVNGATLTTDRFGNPNKAYFFDGMNDKIDFGNSIVFEFGQNHFSISLWAKFSNSQYAPLLTKRNDSPNFDQYSIFVGQYGAPDSAINFYYKPSPGGLSGPLRTFASPLLDSSWHNIIVAHSFGDSTSLFVDGLFVGKSNTLFTTDSFNIIGANLMAGFTNVLGTDYYFKGSLDDIRIYNRKLNALEADSLFKERNPIAVGIKDAEITHNKVAVYPNPTTGSILLSNPCNLTLTDITGKVIFVKNNTSSVDISTQPTGM